MSGTTPNFNSGYGFIQADSALVVPTLSLAAAIDPARQFDHAHLVVDLRDGLHRVEHTRHDLERGTGNERQHDTDSHRRGHARPIR